MVFQLAGWKIVWMDLAGTRKLAKKIQQLGTKSSSWAAKTLQQSVKGWSTQAPTVTSHSSGLIGSGRQLVGNWSAVEPYNGLLPTIGRCWRSWAVSPLATQQAFLSVAPIRRGRLKGLTVSKWMSKTLPTLPTLCPAAGNLSFCMLYLVNAKFLPNSCKTCW